MAQSETVTGREASGLQTEETGCNCQTFFYLSLKWQEETKLQVSGFFPPLYKIKRRFLLKVLCCYDDTWFHLNLTSLKLCAHQCGFLMETFSLSYGNKTMYLLWNLPLFKMVPPKTNFFFLFLNLGLIMDNEY